jgi:predicted nucleic acid-binding protein
MFLLDTDTIIYNLKGHETVKKNLQHYIDAPLKISVITLMELYYGAYKSEKCSSNLAKVRTIESAFEIIPNGRESAENFGMLKASLEKSGSRLDDFDLTIASGALAHNLTLVTNNSKHFSRIQGLKVTNWAVYPEKDF